MRMFDALAVTVTAGTAVFTVTADDAVPDALP